MTGPTLHFGTALTPAGWQDDVRISCNGGRIVSVEPGVAAEAGDERYAIGLPGMPNLHSHAFQRAMAGMAEARGPGGDDFWSWRQAMYGVARQIGPEDLRAVAAMAYVEMLESGFTRVGEFHYLHHDAGGAPFSDPATMSRAVIEAAAETAIGLTHLPVFYAHSGFGGLPPATEQERFVNDVDSFARLFEACSEAVLELPDGRVGVAPHSLRAVDREQLNQLAALAAGAPVHIHVAEQTREVDECLEHTGARPVDWLIDRAPVGPTWCLVHATHITPDEIARIAASGAVAGLCPITEANLGDGVFPAAKFLEEGGAFGIGSDSNVRIDMTEELRLLEYGQRLTRRARNVLATDQTRSTGRTMFEKALSGGSQALGVGGGLAAGRPADIISLNHAHPALAARSGDAILDSLIFAGGRSLIRDVWRAGRHVVSEGRHHARETVEQQYRDTIARLCA